MKGVIGWNNIASNDIGGGLIALEDGGIGARFGLELGLIIGTESGTTFELWLGSIVGSGFATIVRIESGTTFSSALRSIIGLIVRSTIGSKYCQWECSTMVIGSLGGSTESPNIIGLGIGPIDYVFQLAINPNLDRSLTFKV